MSSLGSGVYFLKGFNDMDEISIPDVIHMEKDFILDAGNRDTCKWIGDLQDTQILKFEDSVEGHDLGELWYKVLDDLNYIIADDT